MRRRGCRCRAAVCCARALHWHTVRELDKRALECELDPVDLSGITVPAMDEFAIQRGHRYAAVVIEPYNGCATFHGSCGSSITEKSKPKTALT